MEQSQNNDLPLDTKTLISGGGEMGERVRSFDWSTTSVGPIEDWPHSLRTTVTMLLNSRFPMFLWWGPELIQIYNDGYRPSLGLNKHPLALGQRGKECWPEIWPIIGPQITAVMEDGASTWNENHLVPIHRNGKLEEVYWTYSYSPIHDESNKVAGVLVVVNETTNTVIGQRRLKTLGELAAATGESSTVETVCTLAVETLAENFNDLPYILMYLLDPDRKNARLVSSSGFESQLPPSLLHINIDAEMDDTADPWSISTVLNSGKPLHIDNPVSDLETTVGGQWPEAIKEALVLPITPAGFEQTTGILITGISPRLPFNNDYQNFLELVGDRIATAFASARAYEQERQRAEALSELDQAKTVFFSNVSHEFRTPLTLMLGLTEDILELEESLLSSKTRQQLEVVYRNSLWLLKLVNTLLEFSRIEAGRLTASFEPVQLDQYTAELASVFHAAVERAGLRLLVNCAPLSEPVYIDRYMWEKIVLNLISNALKFTLEGEIEVSLHEEDNQAILTVRDSGVGIATHELPWVFDRFHRVRGSRGRSHEGTGIGLALVEGLVKLHSGSVHVESTLNEGSRFTVLIPFGKSHLDPVRLLDEPDQSLWESEADAFVQDALRWLPGEENQTDEVFISNDLSSADQPLVKFRPDKQRPKIKPRIILADDNADMRNYLGRLLSERYQVETVKDGQEALEAVRSNPPALVLADVIMPRLDGMGLLKELRNDSRLKDIPIVLLSARAGEDARIEGRTAGADDYLIKPFSSRELLARVESAITIHQLRSEASQSLRESEARARLAADIARIGTWYFDLETEMLHLDDRLLSIFGLPPEKHKMTAEEILALIHHEDIDQVIKYLEDSQTDTLNRYALEYRIIRPDGEIRWISANGQSTYIGKGENRQVVTSIGTLLDITSQKESETALREMNTALEQRVAERTRELDWQNERLRNLANQLSNAEQNERQRLTRTLHDGLQQILVAGKMQLLLFSEDSFPESLEQLQELFDEAIEICQTLTYELSPPVLYASNLPEAMIWLADWFKNNHRFEVELQVEKKFPILPDHQKMFLFNAVRELLFNSIKHSGVKKATVYLRQHPDGKTVISVTDEGKGFNTNRLDLNDNFSTGYGLFSIRERLRALGGALQIHSDKETGTTCVLILPPSTEEEE